MKMNKLTVRDIDSLASRYILTTWPFYLRDKRPIWLEAAKQAEMHGKRQDAYILYEASSSFSLPGPYNLYFVSKEREALGHLARLSKQDKNGLEKICSQMAQIISESPRHFASQARFILENDIINPGYYGKQDLADCMAKYDPEIAADMSGGGLDKQILILKNGLRDYAAGSKCLVSNLREQDLQKALGHRYYAKATGDASYQTTPQEHERSKIPAFRSILHKLKAQPDNESYDAELDCLSKQYGIPSDKLTEKRERMIRRQKA